jgi:hypothetical protein
MLLQPQKYASRQQPLHEQTFRLDLVLYLETRSIAELDIVCERAHEDQRSNYLLDKLKAARSPSLVSSGAHPPKTYITPSMRTAACPLRGDGMDPVHCSSVHFRVEMLNDQVSLKSCGLPRPPNLHIIIMTEEGEVRGIRT